MERLERILHEIDQQEKKENLRHVEISSAQNQKQMLHTNLHEVQGQLEKERNQNSKLCQAVGVLTQAKDKWETKEMEMEKEKRDLQSTQKELLGQIDVMKAEIQNVQSQHVKTLATRTTRLATALQNQHLQHLPNDLLDEIVSYSKMAMDGDDDVVVVKQGEDTSMKMETMDSEMQTDMEMGMEKKEEPVVVVNVDLQEMESLREQVKTQAEQIEMLQAEIEQLKSTPPPVEDNTMKGENEQQGIKELEDGLAQMNGYADMLESIIHSCEHCTMKLQTETQ